MLSALQSQPGTSSAASAGGPIITPVEAQIKVRRLWPSGSVQLHAESWQVTLPGFGPEQESWSFSWGPGASGPRAFADQTSAIDGALAWIRREMVARLQD